MVKISLSFQLSGRTEGLTLSLDIVMIVPEVKRDTKPEKDYYLTQEKQKWKGSYEGGETRKS